MSAILLFVCFDYPPLEDFRSSAKRSIHIRVLELLRHRRNHIALVESAVEVLIIYAELSEGETETEREKERENLLGSITSLLEHICIFSLLRASRRHEH